MKTLGNVIKIETGEQLNKCDMLLDAEHPVVNGGIDFSGYTDKYNSEANTITISQGGASAGYVNWLDQKFWAGAHCYVVTPLPNNDVRFLYHFIKSREYNFMKNQQGAGIPSLNRSEVYKTAFPDFDYSKQKEIADILDSFTAMITNLETELASRQKQYEHYRNQLLTFDENDENVEWKTISEVADNYTGLTYKPENIASEGTLVLRSSNIQDYRLAFDDNVFVSEIKIPERAIAKKGDILVCVRNGSRALVGKCAMITQEASGMAFGAFMTVLRCKDINNKYLFYVWQTDKIVKQYKGDEAMPINQITSKDFSKIIIPVVSIEHQREIVSTLDAFESLIANIKRELEARKKQYEYYREKLLTFE